MHSTGQRGRRNINWFYRPNEHMSDYSSRSVGTYTCIKQQRRRTKKKIKGEEEEEKDEEEDEEEGKRRKGSGS